MKTLFPVAVAVRLQKSTIPKQSRVLTQMIVIVVRMKRQEGNEKEKPGMTSWQRKRRRVPHIK